MTATTARTSYHSSDPREVLAACGTVSEDVLRACADRLEHYQAGRFACEHNLAALLSVKEALEALGIDPVHYLVVPRVIGMALAVLAARTGERESARAARPGMARNGSGVYNATKHAVGAFSEALRRGSSARTRPSGPW